jgi:hypothetical protein
MIIFYGRIEPAFAVRQARKLARFIISYIHFICD